MIVAVFPGQGSQTPGFLSPWLELDGVRERLEQYSDAAGIDLIAAGTEADADAIRDTAVAQPLIVAASLISWAALQDAASAQVFGVAGHSVGEIAALVAAEVLGADDGMRLVALRGRAMADAARAAPSGMSAVLGGDTDEVLTRLADGDLTPANYNGGGQIVAAGSLAALAALKASPPSGARVIELQVAGAFHTGYMAPALDPLRRAADDTPASDPVLALWTNRDGSRVGGGREALDNVVAQMASPVRWDLCMSSFAETGVTGVIELAPAGTLTGLARRGLRGTPTVAVRTPEDLAAAAALVNGDDR